MHWTLFESNQPTDDLLNDFISQIRLYLCPASKADDELSQEAPKKTQEVEKYNIRKVLNMESTVRFTAMKNLGMTTSLI